MLIEQLTLTNILSFGPEPETVTFGPLTVLIGANGSGKSNVLAAIDLLRNAPDEVFKPVRQGGGVTDWLWKGGLTNPVAKIDAVLTNPDFTTNFRYVLSFTESAQRPVLIEERLENENASLGESEPYFYYKYKNNHPVLNVRSVTESGLVKRSLRRETIDADLSIFTQRRDPEHYPEITSLVPRFGKIRLYREWSFGRYTPPRLSQRADMPNDWLEPDASNLGLIMNRLRRTPAAKARFLEALRELYDGIEDFDVQIEGGSVQAFLHEGQVAIPATRLSDGTLRYLCLLAILCHPNPPPLVCIEEPELGLHPDIIRTVAKLLKEASERCQLIVTTHSDILVDAMTDTPEAIVVCEKQNGATKLHRLTAEEMAPWLEKYRLGELWTSGQIGGNRW